MPSHRRRRVRHAAFTSRVAALLAFSTLTAGILLAAPATAGQNLDARIAANRAALGTVSSGLDHVQGQIATAHAGAAALEAEVAATTAALELEQGRLVTAELRTAADLRTEAAFARRLAADKRRIATLTGILDARARTEYMDGGAPALLDLVLGSTSFGEVLSWTTTLNRVAQSGDTQLTQLVELRMQLAALRLRWARAAAAAWAAERQVRTDIADLTAVAATREHAEAALNARIGLLAGEAAGLRHRSVELQQLLGAEQAEQARLAEAARLAAQRAAEQAAIAAQRQRALAAERAAQAAEVAQPPAAAPAPQPTSWVPPVPPAGPTTCPLGGVPAAQVWIIMHESSDDPYAQNPTSTAFGLGQLLLANRIYYLGANYATTNCALQLQAMTEYIAQRYGTPQAAQAFWEAHNWY